jgi:drug/metabolite transporter (DMT)-like permease
MSMFDDTILAFGSCIAGLGILISGLLALLFRNPNAPRWTRPEIVPMLICVVVTAIIGLGLGYTAYGLSRLVKGTGDPSELLVLAAVVIALVVIWRALGIQRRLKDYAAVGTIAPGAVLAPKAVLEEEPPPRPKPGAGSGRRAA